MSDLQITALWSLTAFILAYIADELRRIRKAIANHEEGTP